MKCDYLIAGYQVGLNTAVMWSSKVEEEQPPIAYLYNGIQLPALPEWDREMYPYAYISYSYTSSTKIARYTLNLWPYMFTAINEDWSGGWELLADGDTYQEARFVVHDGVAQSDGWSELTIEETPGAGWLGSIEIDGETVGYAARLYKYDSYSGSIIWSNNTFLVENGEVWIEASDPVPVYE